MKKLLLSAGMLFGLAMLAHAGTPLDTYFPSMNPVGATTIVGSSATLSGGNNCTATVAAPATLNSGGGSFSGRNCFTKIIAQMDTGATFYLLDGGTTDYALFGQDLGSTSSTSGYTITLADDHLGPLCMGAGNITTIKVVGTAARNAVNYEGYTSYGINSTLNTGQ